MAPTLKIHINVIGTHYWQSSSVAVVLVINAAQSYILLTANLDDVQSIARQMVQSPVAEQLKKIWRRATNHFNQQVAGSRTHKRAEDEEEAASGEKPSDRDDAAEDNVSMGDNSSESVAQRRKLSELAELGKNASLYLSSIKQVLEKI